jgi:hypothetical protein
MMLLSLLCAGRLSSDSASALSDEGLDIEAVTAELVDVKCHLAAAG